MVLGEMRLKMAMSGRGLIVLPSRPRRFPAHLLGCIATRTVKNLDFVWFKGCVIFSHPTPSLRVTRPPHTHPSFDLLDGPSASEASCFVSQASLQHPCAAPSQRSRLPPPAYLEHPCVFPSPSLLSCTTSNIKLNLSSFGNACDATFRMWSYTVKSQCYLKWQDGVFLQRWSCL